VRNHSIAVELSFTLDVMQIVLQQVGKQENVFSQEKQEMLQ
jgi:hypothetical protein